MEVTSKARGSPKHQKQGRSLTEDPLNLEELPAFDTVEVLDSEGRTDKLAFVIGARRVEHAGVADDHRHLRLAPVAENYGVTHGERPERKGVAYPRPG